MVRAGRNQRCLCGSGLKVKFCCGQAKGPSEDELAKATLVDEGNPPAHRLVIRDEEHIHDLYREMLELPTLDRSMLVDLPRLLTPEIERLLRAIETHDLDGIDASRSAASKDIDTPTARLALLEAARRLHDHGRISSNLLAAVAVDLARRESDLVQSSLVQAVAVAGGAIPTATGLVVATR